MRLSGYNYKWIEWIWKCKCMNIKCGCYFFFPSDSYFTSSPCDENDTTYVKRANVTRGQSNPDTNETGDELAQHSEPTYRVLTADVSDQLNSTKEDEQGKSRFTVSTCSHKCSTCFSHDWLFPITRLFSVSL